MNGTELKVLPDYVGEWIPFHARVIFILVGILYIIAGVIGNGVIIVTVITTRSMHNPHYYFIVNLAIADIVITGYVITWTVVGLILDYYPMISFSNCVFNGMIIVCAYIVSLVTLMVISINRYLNICRKELFNKLFSRKTMSSVLYCAFIWMFGILALLPPLLGCGRFHFDRKTHYCGYDRTFSFSYTLFLNLVSIGVPVGIVFACNFAIWRYIRQASHRIYDSSAQAQISRHRSSQGVATTVSSSVSQSVTLQTISQPPSPARDSGLTRAGSELPTPHQRYMSSVPGPLRSPPPAGQIPTSTGAFLALPQKPEPARLPVSPRQKEPSTALPSSSSPAQNSAVHEKQIRYSQPMSKLVTPDELALIKSLFVVFICFAVLMSPYMMTTILDTDNQWPSWVHLACSYTSFTNSVINWLVYGLMNKRFRVAYRKLFCCRRGSQ